jgi:hypothetical protein
LEQQLKGASRQRHAAEVLQRAGVGLGAETAFAIRDVTITNCACNGVQRPLQIEMWEAGSIENVTFSNITGHTLVEDNLERPIYLDIQQHGRPDPSLGRMRNVIISNMALVTCGRLMVTAQDGSQIEDLTIRDVQLTYPETIDWAALVSKSRCTQSSNYSRASRLANSVLVADNVDGLHVANLSAKFRAVKPGSPKMHGIWCRNVRRGFVDCPRLTASARGHDTMCQRDSDVTVRAIGCH